MQELELRQLSVLLRDVVDGLRDMSSAAPSPASPPCEAATPSEYSPAPPPCLSLVPRSDARAASLAYDGRPMRSVCRQCKQPEECTAPENVSPTAEQLKDRFHAYMAALTANLDGVRTRKHIPATKLEPTPEPEPETQPETQPELEPEPERARTRPVGRLPSAIAARSYNMEIEAKLHDTALQRLAQKRARRTPRAVPHRTSSSRLPAKPDARVVQKHNPIPPVKAPAAAPVAAASGSSSSAAQDGSSRHRKQVTGQSLDKWWLCTAVIAVRAGVPTPANNHRLPLGVCLTLCVSLCVALFSLCL